MTTTELTLIQMGLEVAKLKGEYDAQLREITYLRSALEAKQNCIKPDVSGRSELLKAFAKKWNEERADFVTIDDCDIEDFLSL